MWGFKLLVDRERVPGACTLTIVHRDCFTEACGSFNAHWMVVSYKLVRECNMNFKSYNYNTPRKKITTILFT